MFKILQSRRAVAQHFDEIDTARTGKVTLKQVQQFIEQRRQ